MPARPLGSSSGPSAPGAARQVVGLGPGQVVFGEVPGLGGAGPIGMRDIWPLQSPGRSGWTRPCEHFRGLAGTGGSFETSRKPLGELAGSGLYWPLCCAVGSPGRKRERWGWVWVEVEHAGF